MDANSAAVVKQLLSQKVIAFRRELVDPAGGVLPALVLSQALYWQGIAERAGKEWWWKSHVEWTDETGLTRKQQEIIRRKLRERKLVKEERRGSPCTVHFKVNMPRLIWVLAGSRGDPPEDEDDVSVVDFSCADERNQMRRSAQPDARNGASHPCTETSSETSPSEKEEGGTPKPEKGPKPGQERGGCAPENDQKYESYIKAAQEDSTASKLEEAAQSRPRIKKGRDARWRAPEDARGATPERRVIQEIVEKKPKEKKTRRPQRPRDAPDIRPEQGAVFAEWAEWAAEKLGRTEDWNISDLLVFMGRLVNGFLGLTKARSDGAAAGKAKTMLKDLGAVRARETIEWLVEHWRTFAADKRINRASPTIGIALVYANDIRFRIDGHLPPKKASGSTRGDNVDYDAQPRSGWG